MHTGSNLTHKYVNQCSTIPHLPFYASLSGGWMAVPGLVRVIILPGCSETRPGEDGCLSGKVRGVSSTGGMIFS